MLCAKTTRRRKRRLVKRSINRRQTRAVRARLMTEAKIHPFSISPVMPLAMILRSGTGRHCGRESIWSTACCSPWAASPSRFQRTKCSRPCTSMVCLCISRPHVHAQRSLYLDLHRHVPRCTHRAARRAHLPCSRRGGGKKSQRQVGVFARCLPCWISRYLQAYAPVHARILVCVDVCLCICFYLCSSGCRWL